MITQIDPYEQISDRLMAEQLTGVMRNFSASMIASFCNTLVFVVSSLETPAFSAALIWAVAIWSIFGLILIRQWRRHSVSKSGGSNRRRGIQHLVIYALGLGLAWAALPALFFADAALGGKLLIACLTSGMLGGGVFVLASVPTAAIAFSGPIALGALFALLRVGDTQHTMVAIVLAGYAALLFLGAFNYEKELRNLIATQVASEQRASVSTKNLGAMAELAAGLAHEISQPLSAATAYVQTAERLSRLCPDERPLPIELPLRDALTQLDNVRQMISHLRSSIEGQAPERELLRLHEVIRGAIEISRLRQEETGVRIDLNLAAKNDTLLANAVQIRQLFSNLISNAFDAMEDSKKRVLSISSRTIDENTIRIEVADSGAGISPAVRHSLFEPLITTKEHGLGVGLSIIHSIVKEHEGQIWTEPNPGGGTVFVLALPVERPERV